MSRSLLALKWRCISDATLIASIKRFMHFSQPWQRLRSALLMMWLVLFSVHASATVVKPDSLAARTFAEKLQSNFAARKSEAILEMVDNAAFNERLFREPNAEASYPWAKWKGVAPALATMSELDAFPFLVYARVVLDNDTRTLECEFMNATGSVQSATFFLVERDDGSVRISDFQWGGDAMPKSQIIRESILMEGVSLPHMRGDEFRLERMGQSNGAIYRNMTTAFQQGRYNDAYAFWHVLPDEVRRTRIGRHYLTCLDTKCREASSTVMKAILDGEDFDPLIRFQTLASTSNDPAAISSALDVVLVSRQDPPVYECLKAGYLLVQGRNTEAYSTALNTLDLEPAMPLAYIVAIRASAKSHPDNAVRLIQRWSRVTSPTMIDEFVGAAPDLNEFRSSKEYAGWKQVALLPADQQQKG